jgi:integrase
MLELARQYCPVRFGVSAAAGVGPARANSRCSRSSSVHSDGNGQPIPATRARSAELGMKVKIGCHTFRATGITAYLEAGGTLENAQAMAAHESPRTTKLYDRTGDEITLDEVERITI